ncbi:DUF417 family protein [Pinirhizobacter soli]|uniref:DUF417 family protein n=1 Tax=Pinirhizobacter soli TaxID=2786953 RepID=UPI00202A336F|nr:DUF417 family protein [Pinirhizobacter soli]
MPFFVVSTIRSCGFDGRASSLRQYRPGFAISLLVDGNSYFNAAGASMGTLLAAVWFALAVGLVQSRWRLSRVAAAFVLAFAYAATLVGFFAPGAWKEDFGGFPAIGDAQGVIKHVAIAALAAWIGFVALGREQAARGALAVARWGVVAVLLVIGGAKFASYEAEGIDRLLVNSPVLGWMRHVWGVREVSDIIGVVEILTGVALIGWPYRRRTGAMAILMCVATFLTTLTFVFSLPGWSIQGGMPWLSGHGIFFIEDQLLLLICVLCAFLEAPRLATGEE